MNGCSTFVVVMFTSQGHQPHSHGHWPCMGRAVFVGWAGGGGERRPRGSARGKGNSFTHSSLTPLSSEPPTTNSSSSSYLLRPWHNPPVASLLQPWHKQISSLCHHLLHLLYAFFFKESCRHRLHSSFHRHQHHHYNNRHEDSGSTREICLRHCRSETSFGNRTRHSRSGGSTRRRYRIRFTVLCETTASHQVMGERCRSAMETAHQTKGI